MEQQPFNNCGPLISAKAIAEKYFDNAEKQATALGQSLSEKINSGKAGLGIYRDLRDAVHPQRYKLQKALVQRDQGSLRASEAALLAEVEKTRLDVQTVLNGAKLKLPTELETAAATTLTDITGVATEKLSSSIEAFQNVEQGETGDASRGVQNAAKVGRLIASITKLQLLDLKATLGDAAAKSESVTLKADALALRDEIVTSGYALPKLPGEFAAVRVIPTAVPITPPASPDAPAPETDPATPPTPASAS